MTSKSFLSKEAYTALMRRPRWKQFGHKPIIAKRAVQDDGYVVVERADGSFSTNRHFRHIKIVFDDHIIAVSVRCLSALFALGVYTAEEQAMIKDYQAREKERLETKYALDDLQRIGRKYNFRVPKKLNKRPAEKASP